MQGTRWVGLMCAAVAGSIGAGETDMQIEKMQAFDGDVALLKKHQEVMVLSDAASGARVAVVPAYQGRVMTSTGGDGSSFGWINHELVAKRERQPHINVFGGEDRFWLGPEGGQFSVFFAKDDPFDLAHWQTPAPIDWDTWKAVETRPDMARFEAHFSLTNYSGVRFDVAVDRTVRVYKRSEIERQFGIELGKDVGGVGYATENRITNAGKESWRKESGLLSIWILGMFKPAPATTIVIPFIPGDEAALGPIVNDAYFGKVPADRLKIDPKGVLYFRGDGAYRSKIGIPPRRARDMAGSYDADAGVLTLVKFTLPKGARDYVNSMWELQKEPFGGDVANSYNDGPPAPGQKPLGPFYELESSSPAAALAPGKSLTHIHRTVHLKGAAPALDAVARAALGVGLADIASAFKPR